jgi:hypothetical protein
LIRIVTWSQKLVCDVLTSGVLAVDLTAGKGRDTLALAHAVGPTGQVIAFDLQQTALEQTAGLLKSSGFTVNLWPPNQILPENPGIFLVHACHSTLGNHLRHHPSAIMANLGYLPGGDPLLITRPKSTLAALQQSLTWLKPGGRLSVTVYPSHPGGSDEGYLVDELFSALPQNLWNVLSLRVSNCSAAPYLVIAERIKKSSQGPSHNLIKAIGAKNVQQRN